MRDKDSPWQSPRERVLTPEEEEAKLLRTRRARFNLEVDEAPLAYFKRHFGVALTSVDEAIKFALKHPLTDTHAKLTGYLAVMVMEELALRGDTKAAEALMRYVIGLPDRGYQGRVEELDSEAVAAEIEAIWKAIGAPDALTEALLTRAREPLEEGQ